MQAPFVCAEITDVENEVNGLTTYDRAVLKVDTATFAAAHKDLLATAAAINKKP